MSDLDRRVLDLLTLVAAKSKLLIPHFLRLVCQLRNRRQIKIGPQMPEHGAGNAHKRSIREFLLTTLNSLHSTLIDNNLMISGLDETSGDVFNLLASLNE